MSTMIKLILISAVLAMSNQALSFQHPEQDRCNYLAENIRSLHSIGSDRQRFIAELRDLQSEFELRLCPVVAGYLVSGLGTAVRTGFEEYKQKKSSFKKTVVRKSPD
jgi:hypothetical protein